MYLSYPAVTPLIGLLLFFWFKLYDRQFVDLFFGKILCVILPVAACKNFNKKRDLINLAKDDSTMVETWHCLFIAAFSLPSSL